MISEKEKIKKNLSESIICPKHNSFATHICLEEKCSHKINCLKCFSINKHSHLNIIEIDNMINIKDEFIFNERINYEKKSSSIIKKEFDNFKENIVNEIDSLEVKIIKDFKFGCFFDF